MNTTAWTNAGLIFGCLVSELHADNLIMTVVPGGVQYHWPVAIGLDKFSQRCLCTDVTLADIRDPELLAREIATNWANAVDTAVTAKSEEASAAYRRHLNKRTGASP